MKWNWGTGIAVFFTLFVIVILSLVFKSFRQSNDLVAPDYYAQEVAYQQVIDAKKNTNRLQITIADGPKTEGVRIRVSPGDAIRSARGTIHLYRPDNARLDKKLPLEQCTQDSVIAIGPENFLKGRYKIILEWNKGGIPYYWEKQLSI